MLLSLAVYVNSVRIFYYYFYHCSSKVVIDCMQLNGYDYSLLKLYLQKQATGLIRLVDLKVSNAWSE